MNEIRLAARRLCNRPAFTLMVVLTLALGIGANAAIFSAVQPTLLSPLPYPEPERLVQVFEALPDGGRNPVSGGAFKDWQLHSRSFAGLAIIEDDRSNLSGQGNPEEIRGLMVSQQFLSVLGVQPERGRDFISGEDQAGGNNGVVILSHGLWQRRFGGRENVLGEVLVLDQHPHTVVGVLPPHALLDDRATYLRPIVIDAPPEQWGRSGHWRRVLGRLQPEFDAGLATQELHGIKQRLTADYPAFKRDWGVQVVPLQQVLVGDTRSTLVMLFAAVAFVLLIACANVSNLMLARGQARMREMAVCAVLGADRRRLLLHTLTESLLLATAGLALGLVLAVAGVELLAALLADAIPAPMRPRLDLGVVAFSALVAAGCGLAAGLLPAMRGSRPDLVTGLKDGERGGVAAAKHRAQSLLVASELAFTLVLLVGAGLFLRSFAQLQQVDPGFDPEQVLAFDLNLPEAKYPDQSARLRAVRDITERVAALPGIESVGTTSSLPMSRSGWSEHTHRDDRPPSTDYVVGTDFIGGDYFSVVGMSLLSGRALGPADDHTDAARVVVIDARLAEDLYPDQDPIGHRLRLFDQSWEIVGVVASVRHHALHVDPQPRAFLPQAHEQRPVSVAVRSPLPPAMLADRLRDVVLGYDSDQPIANIRSLGRDVHRSMAVQRDSLRLLTAFAVLAVVLAGIGIYGVISHAVGLRRRELGIRAALGANRRDILRLVLRGGLMPSMTGLTLGLLAALGLARLVESLLFQVHANDPLVFGVAAVLLLALAVLSTWLPVRHAAAVDPGVILQRG